MSTESATQPTPPDILDYNRRAWDAAVRYGSEWSIPVTPETVAAARAGTWSIILTPAKPVPTGWFPPLMGTDVLCLASGGGQQGPVLAAAGANVIVFDNSPLQLARDREVAEREGLAIRTVLGDMADLSVFADASFDFIVHPVSNCFVPDVRPVWREAFRVLRPGGTLIAGFNNPDVYVFDQTRADEGELVARHRIPYSDRTDLTPAEQAYLRENEQPLEWSHTLDDQIGGQIAAGFHIIGFYEDGWLPLDHTGPWENPIDKVLRCFMATRALKPSAV